MDTYLALHAPVPFQLLVVETRWVNCESTATRLVCDYMRATQGRSPLVLKTTRIYACVLKGPRVMRYETDKHGNRVLLYCEEHDPQATPEEMADRHNALVALAQSGRFRDERGRGLTVSLNALRLPYVLMRAAQGDPAA